MLPWVVEPLATAAVSTLLTWVCCAVVSESTVVMYARRCWIMRWPCAAPFSGGASAAGVCANMAGAVRMAQANASNRAVFFMVKFLLWSAVKSCQAASRKLSRRALGKSPLAIPTIRVRPGLNPACTHSSPPAAKKFPEILRPCAYCAELSGIAVNGTSKSKVFQEGQVRSGWAVVWGGSTALVLTLSDRHRTGHFDTPLHSGRRAALQRNESFISLLGW